MLLSHAIYYPALSNGGINGHGKQQAGSHSITVQNAKVLLCGTEEIAANLVALVQTKDLTVEGDFDFHMVVKREMTQELTIRFTG